MSVLSVRRLVTAAVADKKVTLAEAERISHTAGRTSGISAAERKEIAKALTSGARFSPGAKAHLEANAAAEPSSLTQLVNAKGIDVLSEGTAAEADKFSPGLKAGFEKFAAILGNNDGDTVSWTARELSVGGEKVFVVSDPDFDKKDTRELVGFFDGNGKELARAAIVAKEDGVTMNWEKLTGGHGAPIGTPSAHAAADSLPASFKKDLEKWATDRNGEDYGKRVENTALPPEVRRQYAVMERTIADGTAAEKLTFQGHTLYALRDFSCVSSVHFFTEDGKKVLGYVDG